MKHLWLILFLYSCAVPLQTEYGNYIYADGSINALRYNYKIDTDIDEMDDLKRISQVNNGAVTKQYVLPENFTFYAINLRLIDYDDDEVKDGLYLMPYRYGDSWLFIKSLEIKIDDKKKSWQWESWDRKSEVIYGGTTMEYAYIRITKEEIEQLINAKEIAARINGSTYYADVPLMKYVQSNWKLFYDEHLVNADLD